MEWEDREESANVEDMRGRGRTGLVVGGGGLIVLIIAIFLGVDPQKIAALLGQPGPGNQQQVDRPTNASEDRLKQFVGVVLGDTERVWDEEFRKMGKTYQRPKLDLFDDPIPSACGMADSAVGPFYCPGDSKVYLDMSFFKEMEQKLNAPGEFARAYVIAHEVGHHVQRLLGYTRDADHLPASGGRTARSEASVRMELQADYLAGVWAHHMQKKYNFLEQGDIESALNAASQIGDDKLQKQATGVVRPDSFTHGTSRQRVRWFSQGLRTGDVNQAKLLFSLPYNEL